jgi:hypothetical protein
LVQGVVEFTDCRIRGRELTGHLVGPTRVVAGPLDRRLDHAGYHRCWCAVVHRPSPGELIGVRLDQVGQPEEKPAAVSRRSSTPFFEGCLSSGHGPIDLFDTGERNPGIDLTGGRINMLVSAPAAEGLALAADSEVNRRTCNGVGHRPPFGVCSGLAYTHVW